MRLQKHTEPIGNVAERDAVDECLGMCAPQLSFVQVRQQRSGRGDVAPFRRHRVGAHA